MRGMKALAAGILAASLSVPTIADDHETEYRENVMYLTMELVDFKAGKTGRAYEIIAEHFAPASKAAGTDEPWTMHFQTGSWDAAFFWEMKEGPAEFTYLRSADGKKWWKALGEQMGGEDKAQELMDEFNGLIAREVTVFGHHDYTEEELANMKKE